MTTDTDTARVTDDQIDALFDRLEEYERGCDTLTSEARAIVRDWLASIPSPERVRIPAAQFEEIKSDALEFAAALCEGRLDELANASVFARIIRDRKTAPDTSSPLRALLDEAQHALDVLAGDVEDTFPTRAEAAADLAMRLRSGLAGANPYDAVTRFEMVDHREGGGGRFYVANPASIEISLQDRGRTLKVFVKDR